MKDILSFTELSAGSFPQVCPHQPSIRETNSDCLSGSESRSAIRMISMMKPSQSYSTGRPPFAFPCAAEVTAKLTHWAQLQMRRASRHRKERRAAGLFPQQRFATLRG